MYNVDKQITRDGHFGLFLSNWFCIGYGPLDMGFLRSRFSKRFFETAVSPVGISGLSSSGARVYPNRE